MQYHRYPTGSGYEKTEDGPRIFNPHSVPMRASAARASTSVGGAPRPIVSIANENNWVVPESSGTEDAAPKGLVIAHEVNVSEERLFSVSAQKKELLDGSYKWADRELVLCQSSLLICRKGTEHAVESVPLEEVVDMRKARAEVTLSQFADEPEDGRSGGTNTLLKLFGRKSRSELPRALVTLSSFGHHEDEEHESDTSALARLKAGIEIQTVKEGHNGGRMVALRFASKELQDEAVRAMVSGVLKARKEAEKRQVKAPPVERMRHLFRGILESNSFAVLSVLVIVGTFGNYIALTEIVPPEGSATRRALEWTDLGLNFMFLAEILIACLAMTPREYWLGPKKEWHWFDVIIATWSMVVILWNPQKQYGALRTIRVLRVFGLFRKFEGLNRIVRSIVKSVLPVINALLILTLVSCIYAIVGTDLFGSSFPEFFGTFSKSLFTMFQTLTGDSWSSVVARSLSEELSGGNVVNTDVALFFVSYVVINGFFIFNVVIAVLLDNFLQAVEADKRVQQDKWQKQILDDTIESGTALDPLYLALSSFSSMDDLNNRILSVYRLLDEDINGVMSMEEMCRNVQKLQTTPPIRFSEADWDIFTRNGELCNEKGEIAAKTFFSTLKRNLNDFMKRSIGARMPLATRDDLPTETILFMLKTLMFDEEASGVADRAAAGAAQPPTPAAAAAMGMQSPLLLGQPDARLKRLEELASRADQSAQATAATAKALEDRMAGLQQGMNTILAALGSNPSALSGGRVLRPASARRKGSPPGSNDGGAPTPPGGAALGAGDGAELSPVSNGSNFGQAAADEGATVAVQGVEWGGLPGSATEVRRRSGQSSHSVEEIVQLA